MKDLFNRIADEALNQKPLSEEQTLELVLKAQDGDSQATNQLIKSYEHIYLSPARSFGSNIGDPLDYFQVACIKLAEAIQRYKPTSNFESFAYIVGVNRMKDHYLYEKRRHHLPIDFNLHSNHPSIMKKLEKQDLDSLIQSLSSDLSSNQKQVIFLSLQNYTLADIARITNTSKGSVKTQGHRARNKMRNCLNSNNVRKQDYFF